ncbi:type I methionyl aminopeptidase [Buchnera aphidicola]|uniref:type I methionyl aminopeptidase n=1 Tax=Buchnera aphidicola TaxID=9 RepID=UPI003464CC33
MKISIKNNQEIEKMRIAGKLVGKVLDMIKSYIVPDISTVELNDICHDYIVYYQKATPACLGYHGFPKSVCISVNEVVCHGIPNKHQKLKEGDIVNIDVTIIKNQYYADSSKMFFVGKCHQKAKNLCKAAKDSLYSTFKIIKPGMQLNVIGNTIQKYICKTPFSIVKEYCGHGIGNNFHEDPHILHHKNKFNTIKLQKGMTFTIEPIINAGNQEVFCEKDGWTVKTKDGSLSAQYEHTILVTESGCEILTLRETENIHSTYINI